MSKEIDAEGRGGRADTGRQADLALIAEAARAAGELAMRYFGAAPQVRMKDDSSPVSEADMAVDALLKRVLMAARPDYGWLSEESPDDGGRFRAQRSFVVDPIDGTRAFIAGKRTWCVSVAVVEAGAPIAGALACPAWGEFFEAVAGGGARRNGQALRVRPLPQRLRIGGPSGFLEGATGALGAAETVPYIPSLAYRIAKVAAGEIDGTFIKANGRDWDIAAADLILREAGGVVLDADGAQVRYGGKDARHGVLVAGGCELAPRLAALISAHGS